MERRPTRVAQVLRFTWLGFHGENRHKHLVEFTVSRRLRSEYPDKLKPNCLQSETPNKTVRPPTCVEAGVLLHAPFAHERLLAVLALKLFGDVVQRSVHLQAVFVGESLAADLAGVRPHAGVIQHVDAEGVELWQGLPADVAYELSFGVRR